MHYLRRGYRQFTQPGQGQHGPTPDRSGAQSGQTLIIFALASMVLLGALGLVIDVGYDLGQRRTMQNVADAASLRGTLDIHRNATTPVTTLWDEVKTIAMQNGLKDPTDANSGATLTCRFRANNDADLGPCSGAIPATASGVSVEAGERHPTFVMSVLGIGTSGTRASASAYVETLATDAFKADAGPFIVCGYNTKTVSPQDPPTMSILVTNGSGKATNPPQINRAAIGKVFRIHGTQVATCNTVGNRFKGVNDQATNAGMSIQPAGTVIKYKPGVTAGPMRTTVAGVKGCDTVQTTGCVMLLPLADNVRVDSGPCQCINTVGWAAFWVVQDTPNSHTGVLLDYVVQAQGTRTWSKAQPPSVVVIRLGR